MSRDDKKYLLTRLSETHSAIKSTIEGLNLEERLYSDTDWRIIDILGHIATWDREVSKSLRAFLEGNEYFIPDLGEDEADFNEEAVIEQRKLTTAELLSEWEQARTAFKDAVSAIPEEKFPGDLLFTWGDERGTITQLVEYMIEHDEEHLEEIEKFLQEAKNG
jgi:hypothetical protein